MVKINKRGYIRTLEAVAAILIIYIFTTSIISRNVIKEASVPKDIELTQKSILNEIESSPYYRNCVLSNNLNCVDNLLKITINNRYGYNFSLCSNNICKIPSTPEKEVYLRSLIISANLTNYNTTSVNIYIWRNI